MQFKYNTNSDTIDYNTNTIQYNPYKYNTSPPNSHIRKKDEQSNFCPGALSLI